MVKISRILLPVDFSERCLGMTPYARALADKYNAEIVLLHVINPVFITPEVGMAPPAAIAVPQWLVAEKSKLLDEFAAKELSGLRVERLVYEGIPEMQIVELAKAENVQLVLMPTHGYGVFRRFLIGSVTAKVLDDVPVPVFTGVHMEKHVHDSKEEFPFIACAVDLKEGSSQTLLAAATLAQDFGAKLGVIHVSPQGSATTNPSDLQPQLEELVSTELSKNKFNFAPANLTSSVQSGDIAQTICGFADRIGASLLVVGRDHLEQTNGNRASSGRLRMHTYSIIRQSPCPVLSL